ncbi:MAG: hypothetical protein JWR90_1015 [Marmoricola sp.]|nr:hypothetical protein [Marmoricola sp.]
MVRRTAAVHRDGRLRRIRDLELRTAPGRILGGLVHAREPRAHHLPDTEGGQAGQAGAREQNPPGDIPDNLAFVKYTHRPGHYSFTHPQGWAQTGSGARVRFTDKLNGVTADSLTTNCAPTVVSARTSDVPRLRQTVPAFQLRTIEAASVPAGRGVHIVFRRNSDRDPVTGKVYRDEVEEYDVWSGGRPVRMDHYGPVGADNVDAYRTMSQSLAFR